MSTKRLDHVHDTAKLVYESLHLFQNFYDRQIVFKIFLLALLETSDVMLVPNAQDTPDIKQAGPIMELLQNGWCSEQTGLC
jgi:hypothetical protein